MLKFSTFKKLNEDISALKYAGDDAEFAIKLISEIDDQIGSIDSEIELDGRSGKNSGAKLGISQLMIDNQRGKFSSLANSIIDKSPELERKNTAPGREEKDYAFKHVDMTKYIYVNLRPTGKRSAAGDDPNELMTAAWDDDVKQFQISKYGMADFNSSDFIIKKGKNYLGVSLKKKTRLSSSDPTLINKSFATLFQDKKFDSMIKALELKAGMFYLRVIAKAKKDGGLSADMLTMMAKKRPSTTNWKMYVQRIDNKFINSELKGSKSLFKAMSDIIITNKMQIANQLVQLIFKADLKELKKVNFDFTLVTGIGDYGPKKGVVVEKGEYKDIDTVTTKLDELFSTGKVDIRLTPGKKQAFEVGAGAAMLFFDLMIGDIPVCNITLRYKGNFRSAPSFMAQMTPEFKKLYK